MALSPHPQHREPWLPHGHVILANYACIQAGQKVGPHRAWTRMLLWCRQGTGTVVANQQTYSLSAGQFMILPWDHRIAYQADRQADWLLGGVHLIPRLRPGAPLTYDLDWDPRRIANPHPARQDTPLPGLENTVTGELRMADALPLLADYIVQWFTHRPRSPTVARQLANVLVTEWMATVRAPHFALALLPAELQAILTYAEKRLAEPLTIADLSHAGQCSPATLNRLFRRHLQTSPLSWLMRQRLLEAARLLRTTSLRVGEVGAAVGIPDPYYFSKLFRQEFGCTASEHHSRHALLEP